MAGLADFRAQYPQYNDMSDGQLADALYNKFYTDMPRDRFNARLGIPQVAAQPQQPQQLQAAQPSSSANGYIQSAANSYLGGVADAARSGLDTITNAFQQTPADAASAEREKTASPLDISGELTRLGSTGRGLVNIGKGALAIAGSSVAPLISGAGKLVDAVLPNIPQDAQHRMGVNLPNGEQIINTALMGMRPSSASPVGPVTKPPSISAADVKSAATQVYQDANVRGTNIPRQAVNQTIGQTLSDFRTAGFRPSSGTDAFSILDEMKTAANPVRGKNGQFQKAQPITADDLDAWSSALGNVAKETQVGPQGLPQATPRAAAAAQLKGRVDDLLATHVPGWSEADANYAAAKTAEGLDRRSVIADIKAGGGDYAAKLAQQAKTILLDPRVTSKFSPEDIAQLKTISQGGPLSQRALNWLGTKLGSRVSHGLGALAGGLIGASHGGAEGAVIGGGIGSVGDALLSKGLMGARNSMANNQVNSLVSSVLQNSPYGRSLAPVQVSPPNPVFSSIPAINLQQFFTPRPALGTMPSYANGQQ